MSEIWSGENNKSKKRRKQEKKARKRARKERRHSRMVKGWRKKGGKGELEGMKQGIKCQ